MRNKFSKFDPTPQGHYVYLHLRKTDSAIFYVGKGKDRRAWGTTGRNKWWKHVVNKHGFRVKIFKDGIDEQSALSLEIKLISDIRKTTRLVNLVDGGGGTCGWKHSPEAKEKISKFNKGKKLSEKARAVFLAYNIGRKATDEQKLKMSLAKKGKPRGPLSEETKRKISASHIGIRPSPETIKKMIESKIGKYTGRNNGSYDHKIRSFVHPVHGVFEGTRADFIMKYGLFDGCVSSVINGNQKTVKKWRLI